MIGYVYVSEHCAMLSQSKDVVVDTAYQAEQDDTCHTYPHTETLGVGRAECGHRALIGADKHCFHYQQIVVKRDDGVDQGYEHEHIDGYAALIDSTGEYEEFAEESGERGGYLPARTWRASL